MRNNDHDELDNIIDGARSSYSDVAPLAGLEQRILNRVRLAEASRRRKIRWFSYAVAFALASLVFVLIVQQRHFDSTPKAPVNSRIAPATTPQSTETYRAVTVR